MKRPLWLDRHAEAYLLGVFDGLGPVITKDPYPNRIRILRQEKSLRDHGRPRWAKYGYKSDIS